ncbi:MAG: recombinase family protein [Formivibrio sp.]|nr:recombinase family protein [Formivibrio sp.]
MAKINKLRLAISYIRWSTPEQKLGDSKRRQVAATEAFCAEHNLILDQRLIDSGLSAYSGKHRKEGSNLSRFLKDVEAGKIPPGSVLIVESLDRLTRQAISEALELFLGIIRHGIDIVTLIDKEWYSKDSLGEVQHLLVSIISLWRAHEDSRLKAKRVGDAWAAKRQEAIVSNLPLSAMCPGWLAVSKDGKSFVPIPERVKLVKLMFWLTLRGWSKRKIVKLLNGHKVPTWGVGDRAAEGWHYSYLDKILHGRAVLGEIILHTKRSDPSNGVPGKRMPASEPLKNYYPQVVPEAWFLKVQALRSGPRGPLGKHVSNLFQGMIKDGEFQKFSMLYRDHGSDWQYLISDHRRVNPATPIFSWRYEVVEKMVLDYLQDLDWSGLTLEKDAEIRKLAEDQALAEGSLHELDQQVRRLVALVKATGGVKETASELTALESERADLRKRTQALKSEISARRGFLPDQGAELAKQLAADRNGVESRLKLRAEIRRLVTRIELYRTFPQTLLKGVQLPEVSPGMRLETMLHSRCIRIIFANQAERWLIDRGEGKRIQRFDGQLPNSAEVAREKMADGEVLVDPKQAPHLKPVKSDEWKAKQALKRKR